jgi:PEP-CTERM motif
MSNRRRLSEAVVAAYLAVGLAAVSMSRAEAANVVFSPGADFGAAPYTIGFGSGMDAATFTFSVIPNNDGVTVDQVSTGGNGMVDSFLAQPAPFQLGILIGSSDKFTAFPSPAPILFSVAEDSVGIKFQLSDGAHFGYVTTVGPEVLQYGFNDTPGGSIATGAGVPEPSTWAMLLIGFASLACAGYRASRRSAGITA